MGEGSGGSQSAECEETKYRRKANEPERKRPRHPSPVSRISLQSQPDGTKASVTPPA
ncbi:hypothetical protein LBMAG48_26870 [Phycisphaerae bacterium]|nr:hypothetical protein LBMAG48_26870 [Phycisphaerae bacterium]